MSARLAALDKQECHEKSYHRDQAYKGLCICESFRDHGLRKHGQHRARSIPGTGGCPYRLFFIAARWTHTPKEAAERKGVTRGRLHRRIPLCLEPY